MLRLVLFGVFVSAVIGQHDGTLIASSNDFSYAVENENIDPIILGGKISNNHIENWQLKNEKFKQCGFCGEEFQAFPGD